MNTLSVVLLILGTAVVTFFITRSFFPRLLWLGLRNGNFFSPEDSENWGWTLSPSDNDIPDGTAPPRRMESEEGGLRARWVRIGRDNGMLGSEGSRLTQTFNCGSSDDRFCTVTFQAKFTQQNNERARVILENEGGRKTGFIPATPAQFNPKTYRISLPGCKEGTVVSFDVTRGDNGHIASVLDIIGVSSNCDAEDRTNTRVGGKLENRDGDPL